MSDAERDFELIDYLAVLWKRRWLIIIPTLVLAVAAGVVSFLMPRLWDVDAIIQPTRFFVRTDVGNFVEVAVADPRQLAGQINQESYNRLIGAELNLDPRRFPRLRAENLRDTKLVRVTVRTGETEKAQAILTSLFRHVKSDLDRRLDVEVKTLATQIAARQGDIRSRELDIQARNIDIDKIQQEIGTTRNKLKISEARSLSLIEEMKGVKSRVEEIEKQQKAMLAEKQGGTEALGLLLYANETQENVRYANTLDESLAAERNAQEDLRLTVHEKEQAIKGLKTEIGKINEAIAGLRGDIDLLNEKMQRVDYAQLVKEPTVSLGPVAPRKKVNIMLAGLGGLFFMMSVILGLEYLRRNRTTP